MVESIISKATVTLISELENLTNNGVKQQYSFHINCDELLDYSQIDIRFSERFKEQFEHIRKLTGPVLYWFEIKSGVNNQDIRNRIIEYSQSSNAKAIPALKKHFDPDSNCLYVGKVKKAIWGRIIQHLGYYKVNQTQGLQLFHWAKGLNLILEIHLYEFEEGIEDIISIFEIELAKHKKPIIGKH